MLQAMMEAHWTFGESLTFLMYVFASMGGWLLARSVRRTSLGYSGFRERTVWWVIAALLLLLAANIGSGALDQLTEAFRLAAMSSGWYPERGPEQLELIAVVLAALLVSVTASFYWVRGTSLCAAACLLLSLLLIAFVLIRSVSLHAVDHIVFSRFLGVTISSMIEAGGLLVVFILMLWRREQLAHGMKQKTPPEGGLPAALTE